MSLLNGCSDPTYTHREELARAMVQSVGWQPPAFDSVSADMQRMHRGAACAAHTANLLENFLATPRPLDAELIDILDSYVLLSRRMEAQYQSAIDDGRPDLNNDESEIVSKCAATEMAVMQEVFERIDFDTLVANAQAADDG
ncbi:hypothetical protein [Neorhodopirellula lusitana]|nr:hypothetical protein [Neorhodopirellula lusitana]